MLNSDSIMTTDYQVDPRVKILGVALLSGLIVVESRIVNQGLYCLLSIAFALYVQADVWGTIKKLRRFLSFFLTLVIVQSVFRNEGMVLLELFDIKLITDQGLKMAVAYIVRMFVIIASGSIIATSSMRNTIQGLAQLKLPYVLGLMTSIGIRFLPILSEEIKNAFTAMALRGIDIKSLPLKKRIDIIGSLFVPIVYGALMRAKKLSESIEMRGYVVGASRTSYFTLKMVKKDYVALCVLLMLVICAYVL